ncbi:MAG TPA: GMC family oxidoreductase N-terminal domain-containing protein, partial [Streptosporangiaceae bacterium]|nr:GMC family oxidoreductase N-terminal domain-containing protein [Streptosporangiaceae bacterium]
MHDYVIVGAGSAGCVLANRLSADPATTVLLLEAGGPDTSPFIHTPAMMGFLPDGPHDWRYRTVPQAYCNLRRFPWPRGRTLGGSSSINYMIYIRGHARDYDRWAELGNKGWSYEDVLPIFKKSEHNERLEDRYHGRGGPLNVADHRFRHPLSEMFVAAAEATGVPANADFNGTVQDGVGFYQLTQKDGLRWSTASAFLRPALARPNLTVVTGALACRIRFEGRRASGVEYVRHGQSARADAAREVLLCGGSVNSPQLLLLSGVGPADDLRAVGVPVVADLPGVGQNLQDHLGTFVRNEITVPFSLYGATPEQLAQVQAEYEATRQGLFTSNIAEAGAFLRTGRTDGPPELQGFFLPYCLTEAPIEAFQPYCHGITFVFYVNRPASRGRITLGSADPLDQPLIDPGYLGDPADLPQFVSGIRQTREILRAGPLGEILGRELSPGPEARSDAEIGAYVRDRGSGTIFHPVGTCKMGTDELAVVDPSLRVHGLDGLRVVDASIMPTLIGGNTNAPAIMIGEKAADLIRSEARLAATPGASRLA